jgi:hypothetical protein
MPKKITIELTEENAAFLGQYGTVRGIAGEKKAMERALSMGTVAVNKALSDLFKSDKEFQDFVATLTAPKQKKAKTKTPTQTPAQQVKGAA